MILPVTGLWRNKTETGKVYWSGNMGQVRVLLFENTHDNNSGKDLPEFNLCFGERTKKTSNEASSSNDVPW